MQLDFVMLSSFSNVDLLISQFVVSFFFSSMTCIYCIVAVEEVYNGNNFPSSPEDKLSKTNYRYTETSLAGWVHVSQLCL